jgi:hypothetical protein
MPLLSAVSGSVKVEAHACEKNPGKDNAAHAGEDDDAALAQGKGGPRRRRARARARKSAVFHLKEA